MKAKEKLINLMDKIKRFIVLIANDVYWFYRNYRTMRGFRYWLRFTKVFWTTSYEKIRYYGGEEEGGWYYTCYCYNGATFTPFGFGRKKAEKQYSEQRNIVVYFETRRGENENMEPQHYE